MLAAPIRNGRVINRAQAMSSDHVVLKPPCVWTGMRVVAVGIEGDVSILVKVRRCPFCRITRDHAPVTAGGFDSAWNIRIPRTCRAGSINLQPRGLRNLAFHISDPYIDRTLGINHFSVVSTCVSTFCSWTPNPVKATPAIKGERTLVFVVPRVHTATTILLAEVETRFSVGGVAVQDISFVVTYSAEYATHSINRTCPATRNVGYVVGFPGRNLEFLPAGNDRCFTRKRLKMNAGVFWAKLDRLLEVVRALT
mmetsp:Transcript_37386/g.73532  ORF Transcript_37386/g.73532 Transcript_37386/m.73532 type:complete len:253 (+) Transcript_37386:1580-2338(+)